MIPGNHSLFNVLHKRLTRSLQTQESKAVAEIAKFEDELNDLRRREWEHKAGSFLQGMLNDSNTCMQYLQHNDPALRYTAVGVGAYHWERTAGFVETIKKLIEGDPDPEVRIAAMDALVHCCPRLISAVTAGKILAGVLKNRANPAKLNRTAYSLLLFLAGRGVEIRPSFEPFDSSNIDQSLVDSAAQGSLEQQRHCETKEDVSGSLNTVGNKLKAGFDAYTNGSYEQAAGYFTAAIDAGAISCTIYCMRGCSLARIAKYEEAVDDFSSAIQIEPRHAIAHLLRSLALAQQGAVDQSEKDRSIAVSLDPSLGEIENQSENGLV